ncbi:unnamed protein product [Darwinula stevensoni]|uniref:Uncharacterized protein n=1 Tax=Darwinula stevensoni TaxID=69355 RepID=A0A7R8X481_9CRUS|nr:unnamed protein product [Darwinula stevensoni]CAG0885154.1 unnamed protein product [Darwinula stevensoni]
MERIRIALALLASLPALHADESEAPLVETRIHVPALLRSFGVEGTPRQTGGQVIDLLTPPTLTSILSWWGITVDTTAQTVVIDTTKIISSFIGLSMPIVIVSLGLLYIWLMSEFVRFESATFKGKIPKKKHAHHGYDHLAFLGNSGYGDQSGLLNGYGDQSGLLNGYGDQPGLLNGFGDQSGLLNGLDGQSDDLLNGLDDKSNNLLNGFDNLSSGLLKRKGVPPRSKPKKSSKKSYSNNKSKKKDDETMTLKNLKGMEAALKSVSPKRVGKWQ